MKNLTRIFSLVLALCMVFGISAFASGEPTGDMMPPGGIIKDAPPDVEALVSTAGNINMELSMTPSEYSTTNTFRRDDTGYIYLGYDVVNGEFTENSNWTSGEMPDITFNEQVTGAGFTALRLSGEDSDVNVTGNLMLTDSQSDNEGVHASDFSGTGAAISMVNNATLNAEDLNIVTYGFVRAGLVMDNYCDAWIKDSSLITFGNNPFEKAWDGYYNSANTGIMLSPPWVLGIMGGVRTINVLDSYCTLVIENSHLASGGWGVISTDGCLNPVIYVIDSELEIYPESYYGMDSGWELFGLEQDAYGSGYGAYIIGGTSEHVYGADIHGTTYAAIAREGSISYQSSKGDIAITSAQGEDMGSVTGAGNNTVIDSVFGFMTHAASDVWIDVLDGTEVNSAFATFLYRDTGHAYFNVDNSVLNPGDGIILQMMDTDDSTVGGFNPFNEFLYEDAGVPSVSGNETGETEYCETVIMTLTSGNYDGDFYNGTGYYTQAGDVLSLTIGEGATVTGDVALTETIHGIPYSAQAMEAIKGYGEDVAYVLMDADFNIVEDEAKAAYIQFTQFSLRQYFLLGHVLNREYYNGYSAINLTVENGGEWIVEDSSLVTYLKIDGGTVYGEVIENSDGSFRLIPSDKALTAGEWGQWTEPNVAASMGMGLAGGSGEASGEASGDASAEPVVEETPTTGVDQVVNGIRLGDLDVNEYSFDELVAMGFDMTPPEA